MKTCKKLTYDDLLKVVENLKDPIPISPIILSKSEEEYLRVNLPGEYEKIIRVNVMKELKS